MSYGANGAVKICDSYGDNWGVAVHYYRKVGGPQRLSDFKGPGSDNCNMTSNIESNPIILFTACVIIDNVDYCASPYQDTGR